MSRRLPVLLLLLLCGLCSCITDAVSGQRRYAPVQWTAEQERELGRESAPNIQSQFDALYPDTGVNEELGRIVAQLVEESPRRDDFDFHFEVLNSSIPNALALPGGYVYITRGLLQELESEAEFVAVLGHELGHVEHRHSMLNASQGAVTGLIVRPLGAVARRLPVGGGLVGATAGIIAAPSVLLGLSFSRKQELEADRRGVYFCAELGYDPREFERVFDVFERIETEAGAKSEFSILRTHPMNEARVKAIRKTLKADYPELLARDHADFRESSPRFLTILEGFQRREGAYDRYDEAQARFAAKGVDRENPGREVIDAARGDLREARRLVPDEPLFAIFEGELAMLAKEDRRAVGAFAEAHGLYERRTPGKGHWKPPFYLGAFSLEDGRAGDAVFYLELAESRFPMNGTISFVLARAYEQAGEAGAAREAYARALEHLPPGVEMRKEASRRERELRKRSR